MPLKKTSEKPEEDWDEWGEHFGKKMEAKFSHGFCRPRHGPGIGGIIIALFILAWGVTWLGNDLGWWQVNFPFWPIVIILIALWMLMSKIGKMF